MQFQLGKARLRRIWALSVVILVCPLGGTFVHEILAGEISVHSTAKQEVAHSSTPPGQESTSKHEDLKSLSIAGSSLTALPLLVGETDEMSQYTRELLRVQWRPGDPIDLYVIRPRGVEKPPAVLYLYDYPSETDRFRDDRYCQRVTQGGFAAIGFVSALTGHRYHDRPMKEWFVSELQESVMKSVHDVQMMLNYLATRGDLDMNQIGMFGVGSGGTIAILAASVDSRIKALDLLNPWGDWPDWMAKSTLIPEAERPRYVTPEFQKRIAFLDPVAYLPKLETQPVRIQDVMEDPVTPAICKKQIESAAPSSAQVVHFDTTRALWDATPGARLFEWIKQKVRPASANPPQAD